VLQRLFFALVLRPFVNGVMGKRVHGSENLPAEDPFLLVANHDSHLDTPLLLSLFPGSRLSRIRPVAAADYWGSGLRRFVSEKLFRVLPIARRGAEAGDSVARMEEALDRGESLILFPEGTRGDPEVLQPFRSGAARLASARPRVPVVPVYLANTGRNLPRGSALFLPMICDIWIGEPVAVDADVARTREAIEAGVRALAEKAEGPGRGGESSTRR
jgi:1-acyl-sn-glycerol-3-phosphate acyltransferase